nr:dual specificity protein phosphatase 3-like [Lytechinus pictus]
MATKSASCTPEELESLCRAGVGFLYEPSCDVNEVYDRVFVGGEEIARDLNKLADLGITHVLNCAEGPARMFRVDTNQAYYVDANIKYCGLPVSDEPRANLRQHFGTAVQFIDEGLAQQEAKVLIHCVVGFSRSATVAIAYLMIRRGMTAQEATRAVRKNRDIGPNDGFLVQLCELNAELHPN